MPKCPPWSAVPGLEGAHTPCWGDTLRLLVRCQGEVLLPHRSSCPSLAWAFSLGLRGRSARSHGQCKLSVDWSAGRVSSEWLGWGFLVQDGSLGLGP